MPHLLRQCDGDESTILQFTAFSSNLSYKAGIVPIVLVHTPTQAPVWNRLGFRDRCNSFKSTVRGWVCYCAKLFEYKFFWTYIATMPIAKGSSMLSLGTWKARSTKYQRFLNLTNVFMLIVSTILLFTSGVLITFYHLTKVLIITHSLLIFVSHQLEFWSWYFYACPMCMLALGLYTFSVISSI